METIVQKQYGTKLRFEFGDEDALFTHCDRSGEVSGKLPYENVDMQNPSNASVRYNYFYRVGTFLYMIALAVALLHQGLFPHEPELVGMAINIASIITILGAIGLCLWRVETKYTILNVGDGKIRVMHGANHDRIMDIIKTRWRARLRELHGFVNFANDREKELQKFIWLKQLGVIDAEEFQGFTEKLRLFMPKNSFRNSHTVRPENLVH